MYSIIKNVRSFNHDDLKAVKMIKKGAFEIATSMWLVLGRSQIDKTTKTQLKE